MTEFHILVPARLASTRLPRKPLADLGGRPMVVRVCERAAASGAASVRVATDSGDVADAVRAAGFEAILTGAEHLSGTDRLAEALAQLDLPGRAVIVNLQGDEPFMPAACLAQAAGLLERHAGAEMATLWCPIADEEEWRNPNVVKLVADQSGRALYFSRAPIPHVRDGGWPVDRARRHVGVYAYRADALEKWPRLPASPLERFESLEQLRALDAGWTIACEPAVEPVPPGIDTPEDLERAAAQFRHSQR